MHSEAFSTSLLNFDWLDSSQLHKHYRSLVKGLVLLVDTANRILKSKPVIFILQLGNNTID